MRGRRRQRKLVARLRNRWRLLLLLVQLAGQAGQAAGPEALRQGRLKQGRSLLLLLVLVLLLAGLVLGLVLVLLMLVLVCRSGGGGGRSRGNGALGATNRATKGVRALLLG